MKKRHLWKSTMLSVFILSLLPIPASAIHQVFSISLSGVAPYYSPAHATAIEGQPIQWVNSTGSLHTITHDSCVGNNPCAFDSGPLRADARFSIYILNPGVYPYFCRLHPIMRGTLIVLEPMQGTSSGNFSALQIDAQ